MSGCHYGKPVGGPWIYLAGLAFICIGFIVGPQDPSEEMDRERATNCQPIQKRPEVDPGNEAWRMLADMPGYTISRDGFLYRPGCVSVR